MSIKNPHLRRFWFEFEQPLANRTEIRLDGDDWWPAEMGITAYTRDDALRLLRAYRRERSLPAIVRVTDDVDVSTVWHWSPGFGVPIWRGVWYPRYHSYPESDRMEPYR